jgi:hypothetical protein
MKTKEEHLQNERQQITEQPRCPVVHFIVDDTARVLPYSKLTQAESRFQNDHYRIAIVWPNVTVNIDGYPRKRLNLLGDFCQLQIASSRICIPKGRRSISSRTPSQVSICGRGNFVLVLPVNKSLEPTSGPVAPCI